MQLLWRMRVVADETEYGVLFLTCRNSTEVQGVGGLASVHGVQCRGGGRAHLAGQGWCDGHGPFPIHGSHSLHNE